MRKYTTSILFILLVIYLSFFRPPSIGGLGNIPNLDKLVHFGMYFVMSFLLWWDSLRGKKTLRIRHIWLIAFLFPVLFSGIIELMQEYCTDYRGGEWFDFLANSLGAIAGSCSYLYLRYRRVRKH